MLVLPISQREFDLYGLSLKHGPNFDPRVICSTWKSQKSGTVGAVLAQPESGQFSILSLRRQVDHRFVVTHQEEGFTSEFAALSQLMERMQVGAAPEPLLPGVKKRRLLFEPNAQATHDSFKLLTNTIEHYPAIMSIGEVYLAMPRPDDNFVSDFRTTNFDSRLWELYLLASFREQGVSVSQDHESPDFFIQRAGYECYVEAVTANPKGNVAQNIHAPTHPPEDSRERLLGAPAVRFAKTLRSKLQRCYESLSHVQGKPFALALADFHAPGSIVWSREALPSYLYGAVPEVIDFPEGRRAVSSGVETLLGDEKIPAGLFRDPSMAHLSGVVFSNSATLGKFNRMGYLAGFRPPGLRMVRSGILYDRTPGALEAIPFELDILSEEYTEMWPGGEAWCQELEVFHNPLAVHPINFDLLPGATHWFESNGEIVCSSMWQWSVLSSVTTLYFEQRSTEV